MRSKKWHLGQNPSWANELHRILNTHPMLLQSIGETYNPTAADILWMVSAGMLFLAGLIWRRYTPEKLRFKRVFNRVKKAWLLMSSEEEKVAEPSNKS